MPGRLLDGLMFSCRHQFSWPRRTEAGAYYQVCVRCGAEYSYDWSSMRRVKRLDKRAGADDAAPRPSRKPCHGSNWKPRERRLRVEVPVLYREVGKTEWLRGTTDNISRSGLLFHGDLCPETGVKLELMFEMPVEISGRKGTDVLCFATLVRTTPAEKDDVTMLAAAISDYDFIENREAV